MAASEFLEDLVSHLPALQVLCNLGYQYLTPAEVNALRDNRKGTVLLLPQLLGTRTSSILSAEPTQKGF